MVRRNIPRSTREYYHVEYKMRIILDGLIMTYEFVIPRSGSFDIFLGPPIVVRKSLPVAGVFQLHGYQSTLD